jgi:hypothetical protein
MSHFYSCEDDCYQNCKVIVTKNLKVKLSPCNGRKWPNYRGMAAQYWMSHQYHLAFYFWWYLRPMQMQSHGLSMTPVSMEQLRATLWGKSIRTQNSVRGKTGNSIKTMVQTISKHPQAWRLKSHVCKSQKRGWNIPSHYNRESNSTKVRSPDLFKKMQQHQKWICIFNVLKTQ